MVRGCGYGLGFRAPRRVRLPGFRNREQALGRQRINEPELRLFMRFGIASVAASLALGIPYRPPIPRPIDRSLEGFEMDEGLGQFQWMTPDP